MALATYRYAVNAKIFI